MAILDLSHLPDHLLMDTDWEGYQQLVKQVGERPGIRITYDRGKLELIMPSIRHGGTASRLGMLLVALMDELEMDFTHGGAITFSRQDLDRGFEPDDCFWIARWKSVADLPSLDLSIHPPPDVILEVEVTRSALNRISIFEAFGIPEVWRCSRRGRLSVLRLGPTGRYELVDHSPTFPTVPLDGIVRHLHEWGSEGDRVAIRRFRAWVKGLRGA